LAVLDDVAVLVAIFVLGDDAQLAGFGGVVGFEEGVALPQLGT
jgi:hypothetical protein